MTLTLSFFFLLVALLLFGIAALGVPTGRVNATAAGLFFLALSMVVPAVRA